MENRRAPRKHHGATISFEVKDVGGKFYPMLVAQVTSNGVVVGVESCLVLRGFKLRGDAAAILENVQKILDVETEEGTEL